MRLVVTARLAAALSLIVLLAAAAQPVAAVGDDVRSLMVGDYHGCVVKTNDSLWCWGDNSSSQMGDGTIDQRNTPVRVEQSEGVFMTGVKNITPGGYDHTCAIKTSLAVVCWGLNSSGQLGDGTADPRAFPAAVKVLSSGLPLTNIKALALGQSHSCALKKNGTVWCWGRNNMGQLGDGTDTDRHAAVQVQTGSGALTDVKAIGAGYLHSCAVMMDGTLRCWGLNNKGQLGIGSSDLNDHPLPEVVQKSGGGDFAGVTAVDGGGEHTCARKASGTLFCFGNNSSGQLGDDSSSQRNNPVKVRRAIGSLTDVTQFAAGQLFSCAVTSGGKPWCWGTNVNGELGLGDPVASVDVATRVKASESTLFTGALSIRTGDSQTCILKSTLTVWCMGYAEYGQIGYDPSPDPDPAQNIYFPEETDFP